MSKVLCLLPSGKSNPVSTTRSTPRPANSGKTGLELQALDQVVDRYFQNGLAAATQRSYNSAKRRYIKFCSERGLEWLPASEHQLCQFVAFLAVEKLCHSTIKCYLAVVRHLHIAEGFGDPHISSMARLEQVLRGVKLTRAKEGGGWRSIRLPMTPDLLLKIREVWNRDSRAPDNIMHPASVSLDS